MNKLVNISLMIMLTVTSAEVALTQGLDRKPAYYASLNSVQENFVFDIIDKMLNLTYTDRYGQQKDILLRLFDWKHNPVASLKLDKSNGLNVYSIDLDEVYGGWIIDEIYTAELRDERGRLYRLPFRLVEPPDEMGPQADIMVNPLQISCDGVSPSAIEFYGNISGGRAPFTVQWFVLNSSRSDFLYQPREEVLEKIGRTSQINVDKNPEYYVVLYVKDACGKEDKKIVNLVCESDRKQINTIFLEELVSPAFKSIKATQ